MMDVAAMDRSSNLPWEARAATGAMSGANGAGANSSLAHRNFAQRNFLKWATEETFQEIFRRKISAGVAQW